MSLHNRIEELQSSHCSYSPFFPILGSAALGFGRAGVTEPSAWRGRTVSMHMTPLHANPNVLHGAAAVLIACILDHLVSPDEVGHEVRA